tara:strand:+ start:3559 stop:5304 length:1746 start_codon:yes stop_codon:yes gene_type:complete
MAWGQVLSSFGQSLGKSTLKGSVKKISSRSLTGRGGKKGAKRQNLKNIMQKEGEFEGGGALAVRPTTSLVPTDVSDSALAVSSTPSGTSGQGVEGILLRIHTKTIAIDKFLKTKKRKDKEVIKVEKKQEENKRRGVREEKVEGKKKVSKPKLGFKNPLPQMGFLQKITHFISQIVLGWITLKLLEWGPTLKKFVPLAVGAFNAFITTAGFLFDALATVIKIGYDSFTLIETGVKNIFGEKGLKVFHAFSDALKTFLTVSIIAAMVAAKAGVLAQAGQVAQWAIQYGWPIAKTVAGGIKKAAVSIVSAPAAIVAGVGLLASAIGEGGFQLIRWSRENLENPARENAEKAKEFWPTDPRRWFWEGAAGIMGFLNMGLQFTFNLLDIIGAPFRYLIELIRWPFLDEAGREKQGDNLAKFDARIREGFRSFFNSFDFLNIISDEEGGWGDMWGGRGAEQMEGNYGYKETNNDEGSNEEKLLGGWISRNRTYNLHAGEIVIDPNSAVHAKEMLLAINAAHTRDEVIQAIKDYAPYEIGGPSVPLVVPMPLINPLPSTQTGSGGGLVGAASGGGTNDVSERLYKGTC